MLFRENRIKKNKEIERVFKKGKGFGQDLLVLKTLKNSLAINRFAFIVSQKVSKKAVVRNRIKRRLREIVRAKIKLLKPGTDNLLIVLPGLEKKDFKNLEETVEKLFKKAKIINDKKNNPKND